MDTKKDIKSLNLEELKTELESMGEKAFRAKQMYEWMHVKLVRSFDEMTNLSAKFREQCKEKYADVVLMDVPCSGLGVMGKKRDIKYHATPESLQSITELQRQIVAAGWQYVKPHGVLLYSTCTIHRGENQEMAVWNTENFPFVLEEERQLLPGTDETDGFYYARLRRKA